MNCRLSTSRWCISAARTHLVFRPLLEVTGFTLRPLDASAPAATLREYRLKTTLREYRLKKLPVVESKQSGRLASCVYARG
jgi:hypothetical protein